MSDWDDLERSENRFMIWIVVTTVILIGFLIWELVRYAH